MFTELRFQSRSKSFGTAG